MNNFSLKVSKQMRDTFIFPKFSKKVFKTLQQDFPQTYYVGGVVRNVLLKDKFSDIDIATSATPEEVVRTLTQNKISFSETNAKFGVITALSGKTKIEITTLRKEAYSGSRYPAVVFTKSLKNDSFRRDFTINAIYYQPTNGEIIDFHNGIQDIKNKKLKFIGDALKRIKEDPLRIVRAYRFALQYNLIIDAATEKTLQQNLNLLKKVSATRIKKEIDAMKTKTLQTKLKKVIHN